MKSIQVSQLRKVSSLLAVVACATVLASCGGGGEYDSGDPNGTNTDNNVNDSSNISAAPALLSRSCDGQQSPQLFCPSTTGG